MSTVVDIGVIRAMRMLELPLEAHEAMENWGRWQRSDNQMSRRSGIEGKNYRSNRCEHCFELPDPCDVCKYLKGAGLPVDIQLALRVERAITYGRVVGRRVEAGMPERDVTILLAHFRGFRNRAGEWQASNPKVLCRQLGIQVAEYESRVAKLVQMIWNRMKQRIAA
ncbi:hypothetical protein [Chromobacterium piscinae]|uniref:hypothetical protein n=1 Tax=Chromobacterium piscinae TaxID=686831 RepID=UPI003F822FB3